MTYPSTSGRDGTVAAGANDVHGAMLSPANHPADGPGVDYGTPAQYYGPAVADQPALVNPSAGTQGPTEQGANDVNPQGPAPRPGATPQGSYSTASQAPGDTSKGNPNHN
jgi:hypothetical protein